MEDLLEFLERRTLEACDIYDAISGEWKRVPDYELRTRPRNIFEPHLDLEDVIYH
jgi:hypothetical protein